MKTIFFHVGYQKTATTALQNFFVNHLNQLKNCKILYPKTGRIRKAHHAFMASFGTPGTDWVTPIMDKEQYSLELKSEFETSGCQSMLVSSEDFSYINDLSVITSLFHEYSCKFIVYLRRQDNWIQSRLKHFIRSPYHGHKSWDIPLEILIHADYASKIEAWIRSVGKENLIIRIYEKEQLAGGSIYTDFIQAIGCDEKFNYINTTEQVHPSLTPTALEICRISNAMKLPFRTRRQIVTHLNNVYGKFYGCDKEHELFSPQQRLDLLNRYAKGNEWIARTCLHREDGILFQESLPINELGWQPPDLHDCETTISIFLSLFESQSERIQKLESRLKEV